MALNLRNINFKDTKTQTIILVILIVAIVSVLYISFIFLPNISKDVSMIGKAIRINGELKEAGLMAPQKDTLKKKFDAYNEKIELYEKRLPAQQEIPGLLEGLSKMARNANITILGITPVAAPVSKGQKEKKNSVYKETPILITAKSGYHELGRFLSNLENGDRFMKVVDISIKTNAQSPKKHDVELMVYTYVLPLE